MAASVSVNARLWTCCGILGEAYPWLTEKPSVSQMFHELRAFKYDGAVAFKREQLRRNAKGSALVVDQFEAKGGKC